MLIFSIGKGSRAALGGAPREQRGAKGEKVAEGEHEQAVREHGGASREQHMAEMGLSAGAMRRYCIFETQGYYIVHKVFVVNWKF